MKEQDESVISQLPNLASIEVGACGRKTPVGDFVGVEVHFAGRQAFGLRNLIRRACKGDTSR